MATPGTPIRTVQSGAGSAAQSKDTMDEAKAIDPGDVSFVDVFLTKEVTTRDSKSANKRYECGECKVSFTRKYDLKRHLLSPSTHQQRCSSCNQFFRKQSDLDEHVSSKHHTSVCETRGETFNRISSLNRHIASQHTEETLSCPLEGCNRTFSRRTDHQDHIKVHTGAKPYSCSYCTRHFASRISHKRHETHCNESASLICNVCSLRFKRQDSLRDHVSAVHGGNMFECTCGAMYKYRSGFDHHKNTWNH